MGSHIGIPGYMAPVQPPSLFRYTTAVRAVGMHGLVHACQSGQSWMRSFFPMGMVLRKMRRGRSTQTPRCDVDHISCSNQLERCWQAKYVLLAENRLFFCTPLPRALCPSSHEAAGSGDFDHDDVPSFGQHACQEKGQCMVQHCVVRKRFLSGTALLTSHDTQQHPPLLGLGPLLAVATLFCSLGKVYHISHICLLSCLNSGRFLKSASQHDSTICLRPSGTFLPNLHRNMDHISACSHGHSRSLLHVPYTAW